MKRLAIIAAAAAATGTFAASAGEMAAFTTLFPYTTLFRSRKSVV